MDNIKFAKFDYVHVYIKKRKKAWNFEPFFMPHGRPFCIIYWFVYLILLKFKLGEPAVTETLAIYIKNSTIFQVARVQETHFYS